MTNATTNLCQYLQPEQIDRLLFRAESPPGVSLPRVYGGQVLAQCLNAAIRTVDQGRLMHSMHAYFLRPGDLNLPIILEVDPIRDGGSFTTRRVVAKQDGKAIFNTSISFKTPEQGLRHQMDLPIDAGDPDNLTPDQEIYAQIMKERGLSKRPGGEPDTFRAFETRTPGTLPMLVKDTAEPVQGMWFKTRDPVDEPFAMHQVLLAYASDFRLMSTGMLPHGVKFESSRLQAASLDHALWIHDEFRVDEWIYYYMESPVSGGGRDLNHGRFYTRDGRLVASATQEGLIRWRD